MDISVSEFKKLVCIEDRLNQLKRKVGRMEEEDLVSKDDVLGILKDMTFKEALNASPFELRCRPVEELTGKATEQIVEISMRRFEIYIREKEHTDLICKQMLNDESEYLYVREITGIYTYKLLVSADEANHRALESVKEEIKNNAGADQEDE